MGSFSTRENVELPVSMIQISTGSCDWDERGLWHLVKLDGQLGTEQAHNPAAQMDRDVEIQRQREREREKGREKKY